MKETRKKISVRHRGSVYIATLSVSMLMTVIGLSTLMVQRIDNRKAMIKSDSEQATILAAAAIEHALSEINSNPTFRSAYVHDVPIPPHSFSGGTFEWRLRDDEDQDLGNNEEDPVTVIGTGKFKGATRKYEIKLTKQGGSGLDILSSVLHAGGTITVTAGLTSTVTATGGPISTNGTFDAGLGTTVNADVDAFSFFSAANITGTKTTLTETQLMPDPGVFTNLKSQATVINYNVIPQGDIQDVLLSPIHNPYGPTNPNGIYYIKVPPNNSRLRVIDSRIVGTLLIELDHQCDFEVHQGVIWEPASPSYPTAIIKCMTTENDVRIENEGSLSEFDSLLNANPPELPLNGNSNSTMSDTHPSVIKGLIHVIRVDGDILPTLIRQGGTKNVIFILDGNVQLNDVTLTHNAAVAANPPQGYGGGTGSALLPVTSSWKRKVGN